MIFESIWTALVAVIAVLARVIATALIWAVVLTLAWLAAQYYQPAYVHGPELGLIYWFALVISLVVHGERLFVWALKRWKDG